MIVSNTQIKSLMADFNVSTPCLRGRMGISRERMTQVRREGLNADNCSGDVRAFALDWFAAITGSTSGFASWTFCGKVLIA